MCSCFLFGPVVDTSNIYVILIVRLSGLDVMVFFCLLFMFVYHFALQLLVLWIEVVRLQMCRGVVQI